MMNEVYFKMAELPDELISEVMHFLNPHDLARLSETCRDFFRLGSEDSIWRKKGFLKRDGEVLVSGNSTVPPARLCHSAVIHNDKIHIFGGHNTEMDTQRFSEVKNDIHTFNIETKAWEKHSIKGIPNKTEHCTVIYDNTLWMFGGYSGHLFSNTLYKLDLNASHCTKVKSIGDIPTGRSALVGTIYRDSMYIFGGWDGLVQNDHFHSFNFVTSTWTKITSELMPLPRCSHSVAVSDSRNTMYIFGGYGGQSRSYLNDIWAYDFEKQVWAELPSFGNVPSPRSRMRMVEWEGKLFIFGGWDKVTHFEDLFQYDIDTNVWIKLEIGGSQDGSFKIGQHSMCVHHNILYIFGGYNAKLRKSTNDLYSYRLGRGSTTPRFPRFPRNGSSEFSIKSVESSLNHTSNQAALNAP